MFRPEKTRWIEILAEQKQTESLLMDLARHGVMELQPTPAPASLGKPSQQRWQTTLYELIGLRDRYAGYLPSPQGDPPAPLEVETTLKDIENTFNEWMVRAGPVIARLKEIHGVLDNLALLHQWLKAVPADINLNGLGRAGMAHDHRYQPWLALTAKPVTIDQSWRHDHLVRRFEVQDNPVYTSAWLGLSDRDALASFQRQLHGYGLRFINIPPWLDGNPPAMLKKLPRVIKQWEEEKSQMEQALNDCHETTDMARQLGRLLRLQWFDSVAGDIREGKHFTWITGWIPAHQTAWMNDYFQTSPKAFLFRYADQPAEATAPVLLRNPSWAKRFEMFVRGFGTPGANDLDPSILLALLMPLMFGYMFGDVGQGAVLLAAGWLLRSRYAVMGLFVPAGAMSIAFGFLYGSVFFYEDWIAPLWMSPMHHPLTLFAIPLVLGVLLILLSMVFDGIQSYWRGELPRWVKERLPLLIIYTAAFGLGVAPAVAAVVMAAALVWRMGFAGADGFENHGIQGAVLAIVRALFEWLEAIIQLFSNTFSFIRVGAFALAHAGLGIAVLSLAAMPREAVTSFVILVLGNALVIVLEGLVVSIQTTRLMMFEFFRRFVHADGRPFQPLRLPDTLMLSNRLTVSKRLMVSKH